MHRMLNVQGLGRNSVVSTTVADGDRGTRQIIRYARQLVAEGLRDPAAHELALQFCKTYGAEPFNEKAELEAVFDGVHDNFDYRKHVVGSQSLQNVSGMMRTRSGDCAELNLILLPVLLGTIGYPTRAVAIKADPSRAAEFSHVYIEALTTDGEWVPMDVARQNTEFGLAPEYDWGRETFDLTPTDGGRMNGYRTARGMGANVVVVRTRRLFPHRGLGDATQDLAMSLQAAPSILGGVAQVVGAANNPYGAYSPYGVAAPGVSANVSGSSAWIALAVLAVIGIAVFKPFSR